MRVHIVFFSRVRDKALLDLVQWYKNDIRILKSIGHVTVCVSPREIPLGGDLYCSWWCTTSIFPLAAAVLMRKPLLVMGHGSEVALDSGANGGFWQRPYWQRVCIRFVLRYASAIFAVSRHGYADLKALGARRVEYVPLAIDTEVFKPIIPKSQTPLIVTISHLDRQHVERKCLRELLQAVPYVLEGCPQARFVIAGEQLDGYDILVEEVTRLGISDAVEFPGRIDERTKLELLSQAWVYAQPSRHEAFGVAIAEAMSCGTPPVVSKVAAIPEVVGECGVYVRPDEPRDIARGILELIHAPEKRSRLGEAARKRIEERYSLEQRRNRIMTILRNMGVL